MSSVTDMTTPLRDEADTARRRKRNVAIAFILAALVVLFYVITIVHLGGDVAKRPF